MSKSKKWVFNKRTENFACAFPGCSYVHAESQGVNCHYMRVHERRSKDSEKPGAVQVGTAQVTDYTAQQQGGCEHDWQMLNAKNPIHAQALAAGYMVYCLDCEELE